MTSSLSELGQNFSRDRPGNVRQAVVTAGMSIGELSMIEAEEVQHCRVEVMDGASVFNGVVAKFVGASIAKTSSDAASGHPHRESIRMMIPSFRAIAFLDRRGSPEFASPKNQGVIEESSFFEI